MLDLRAGVDVTGNAPYVTFSKPAGVSVEYLPYWTSAYANAYPNGMIVLDPDDR